MVCVAIVANLVQVMLVIFYEEIDHSCIDTAIEP